MHTVSAAPGTAGPVGRPREVMGDATSGVAGSWEGADFGAFVEANLGSLLRLGHALAGNPHDGADLVQEVLERVGVHWQSLQRRGVNPNAYVRRALVNARTSRWRRYRREYLVERTPEPPVQPDDYAGDPELWQALQVLPQRQRAVIVLRYFEDLSEKEIAELLGVAPGTVKSQTSRALVTLRRRLGGRSAVTGGEDG